MRREAEARSPRRLREAGCGAAPRIRAPGSIPDAWVPRGLAGSTWGVVRAGEVGAADLAPTLAWARPQGWQGAETLTRRSWARLLAGFPLQPAPESVLVRAHSGSRPLPHAQKLLHKRHTRSLPPSALRTCYSPHTNALAHTTLSLTNAPAHTVTVSTLRHAAAHTLANIAVHNPAYTQKTKHSLCRKSHVQVHTLTHSLHTHILFHIPSSGRPTLDERHPQSPA